MERFTNKGNDKIFADLNSMKKKEIGIICNMKENPQKRIARVNKEEEK